MRTALSVLACLALIGSTQAVARNHKPLKVDVGWRVTINAQGHVTAMSALPHERVDRLPQIRSRLEQEVRSWQFLPGLIDGKPAETETGLYLRASLIAASDNAYRIQINSAGVGGAVVNQIAPRYPGTALHRQSQGEVVLRVAYDATGKVMSASAYPGAPKVDAALVTASETVVKNWQFTPETVGGHGVAGEAIVPFCYTLGRNRGTHCDWKPPGSNTPLRDGTTLALNPAAHLVTDVVGRVL